MTNANSASIVYTPFLFLLLCAAIAMDGLPCCSDSKESAMQETQVQTLGGKDPLEKGMATLSSIFAWRIPCYKATWWATVRGVTKNWTQLSD